MAARDVHDVYVTFSSPRAAAPSVYQISHAIPSGTSTASSAQLVMSTNLLPSIETDTCPRAIAWMAGLSAATGDMDAAGTWLLELDRVDGVRQPRADGGSPGASESDLALMRS